MSRLRWRWEEKDFGFRFRAGSGKRVAEHYQAGTPGDFYVIPASERKLSKSRSDELATRAAAPTSPRVVPNPWTDYDRDWDWIVGPDGILLNYAGCLDQEELNRREDEGVARAMEFISDLLDRPEPAPLAVSLVQQVHRELMGDIYPFAGAWRTVALHRGEGPTRWPMPPGGIEPLMEIFDRDVLSKSPVIADDDTAVIAFAAEVMGEFIAIHPFREGNGRAAFILGNLILMQNDLLPLDVYDRLRDQGRYFEACEAIRVQKDYAPMVSLIREWEDAAIERWEGTMAKNRRINVKAILADPDLRRKLMVSTIQATQAREGIETTEEQADRAYYVVTESERATFFELERFRGAKRGEQDTRHEMFVKALRAEADRVRHDVARRDFWAIDGHPLAFERVGIVAPIFRESQPLEPTWAIARQGKATGDDSRWVRSWWEVSGQSGWVPFAKGGEFCRFYSSIDLVINWKPERRADLKASGNGLPSEEHYFKPGMTWPRRTQRGFNLRLMPEGCIFADKGSVVLPRDPSKAFYLLGVANSAPAEFLLRGLMSFGSWEVGIVKRLPIPQASDKQMERVSQLAKSIHDAKHEWDSGNELSTSFERPWVLRTTDARWFSRALDSVLAFEVEAEEQIHTIYNDLNTESYRLYGVPDATRAHIKRSLGDRPPEVLWSQMEGKSDEQKRMEHVWRLLSFAVKRVVEKDAGGIVPFAPFSGEASLLDRVHDEIAALFPEQDVNQVEVEIANELKRTVKGYKRASSIGAWLENIYFDYHTSLYKKRPIIWHIASSQGSSSSAFGALCHYHKLDANRIAKLRSSYLRNAIEAFRREAALASQERRAEDRIEWQAKLEETQALDRKLQAVQEGHHEGAEGGDRDYRILTPWKSPEDRPKGWTPDIDDGVKVNIEPLQKAGVLCIGKVV